MPRVRRVLHHKHALVLLQNKAAPWEGPEAGQEGWEWKARTGWGWRAQHQKCYNGFRTGLNFQWVQRWDRMHGNGKGRVK